MAPWPKLPPTKAVPYSAPLLSKTMLPDGWPPSAFPLNSYRTFKAQLPLPLDGGLSSNTVPTLYRVVGLVAPYSEPDALMTRPVGSGHEPPSWSWKLKRSVFSNPPPTCAGGDRRKTVPYPNLPPSRVVPYSLPSLSAITPLLGLPPSVPPLNL